MLGQCSIQFIRESMPSHFPSYFNWERAAFDRFYASKSSEILGQRFASVVGTADLHGWEGGRGGNLKKFIYQNSSTGCCKITFIMMVPTDHVTSMEK